MEIVDGTGLPIGFIDKLPSTNIFQLNLQDTCDTQTADLSVSSFSINSFSDDVSFFKKASFSLSVNLKLSGGKTLSGGAKKFDLNFYFSMDNKLDTDKDYGIPYDFNTHFNSELTSSYTSPGDNSIAFSGTGASEIKIPYRLRDKICGKAYIIVAVDSKHELIEVNEMNNIESTLVQLPCSGDVYDLQVFNEIIGSLMREQQFFDVTFSTKVYNSGPSGISSSSDPNMAYQIFIQKGSKFNRFSAVEITPPTLMYLNAEEGQLKASLSSWSSLQFTDIKGTINVTTCFKGADHLFIFVKSLKKNECIKGNNYFSYPLTCKTAGLINIRLNLDRNGEREFKLDTINEITLGESKNYILRLAVDTTESMMIDKFSVKLFLMDGLNSVQIPIGLKTIDYRMPVNGTKELNFDSSMTLEPGVYLPFCKSGLSLKLLIDSENEINEWNEGDNEYIIKNVEVGGTLCSSGLDLSVEDLEMKNLHDNIIIQDQSFDFYFVFSINKPSSSSTSDPPSFKYKVVVADSKTNSQRSVTILDKTYSSIADKKVEDSGTLSISGAGNEEQRWFCGTAVYLGVHINSDNAIAEATRDNNWIWKPVRISCPSINSVALIYLKVIGSNMSGNSIPDSQSTTITFDAKVLNKGQEKSSGSTHFSYKVYLLNSMVNDLSTSTPGDASASIANAPGRNLKYFSREIIDHKAVTATFTVSGSNCISAKYLCIEAYNSGDQQKEDNFKCISVSGDGPVNLDCSRDISITSLSVKPLAPLEKIYRDSLSPLYFKVTLSFTGRDIDANSKNLLSFESYLSDQDNIDSITGQRLQIGDMNNVTFADSTKRILTSHIANNDSKDLTGAVRINVPALNCSTTNRYICLKYSIVRILNPVFKDSNGVNDVTCASLGEHLRCDDESKDVKPSWLNVRDVLLVAGGKASIELYVELEVRGSTTSGKVSYDGEFFLSRDEKFDNGTDIHLPYEGLEYGMSRLEMKRGFKSPGKYVMNLKSSRIDIPNSITICGESYLLFLVDTSNTISERYEDNNMISTKVRTSCPRDVIEITDFKITEMERIYVGVETKVLFDFKIRNVSPKTLKKSSINSPYRMVRIFAKDSLSDSSPYQLEKFQVSNEFYNEIKPGEQVNIKGAKAFFSKDSLKFTSVKCTSFNIFHLIVESEGEAYLNNNHGAVNVDGTLKRCTIPSSSLRDIELVKMKLPEILTVPGTFNSWHIISTNIGSTSVAITDKAFTSTFYLSNGKSSIKIADLSNSISISKGEIKEELVFNKNVEIKSFTDQSFCGYMSAKIKADSEEDITEKSEKNNILTTEILTACEGDFFALSHLDLITKRLSETKELPIIFKTMVTCVKSSCQIGKGDENVKFVIYTMNSTNQWFALKTIDKNSVVYPPLGVTFKRQGYGRTFQVESKTKLPAGSCNNSIAKIKIELDFGSSLSGSIDNVTENNVIMTKVECASSDRDFIATNFKILDENPLKTRRIKYQVDIDLEGDKFEATNPLGIAPLFNIGLYISKDQILSNDDIQMDYIMSECAAKSINNGFPNGTVTVTDATDGAVLPEFICGMVYIFVKIDSDNRYNELNKANNILYQKVYINCEGNIFELVDVISDQFDETVHQFTPSIIYPSWKFDVVFRTGNFDIYSPYRETGEPLLNIVAAFSADSEFSDDDIQISVTMSDISKSIVSNGLLHNTNIRLPTNIMSNINIPTDRCGSINYLLIGLLPSSSQLILEKKLDNNFYYRPLRKSCSTGSQIISAPILKPMEITQLDKKYEFSSGITTNIGIVTRIKYSWWISHDDKLQENLDFNIGYGEVLGSSVFDINRNFTIPSRISPKFCGKVYLLLQIDPFDDYPEIREHDNLASKLIKITCSGDLITLRDVSISWIAGQIVGSASNMLTLNGTVECTGGNRCPNSPPSGNHFKIKLHAYDSAFSVLSSFDPTFIQSSTIQPSDLLIKDFSRGIVTYSFTANSNYKLSNPFVSDLVEYIGVSIETDQTTIGPSEAKTRLIPFHFYRKLGSIDFSINTFTLGSAKADVTRTINMNLIVAVSQSMWKDEITEPLFGYGLYLSSDAVITTDDININYIPSETIMTNLVTSSNTVNLADPSIKLNTDIIQSFCGKDVFFGVILDPANRVKESDETNNYASVKLKIEACDNGVTSYVKSIHYLPSWGVSNQEVTANFEIEHVLTGTLNIPKAAVNTVNYKLNCELLDDIWSPKNKFNVKIDTSSIAETKEQITSGDNVEKGVAVTITHLFPFTFNLPPNYSVCGRLWMIKWQIEFPNKLNTEYNLPAYYNNLYISCPQGDMLVLESIDIKLSPSLWWSDSTNYFQFIAKVKNIGTTAATAEASGSRKYSFLFEQYFSLDDKLDMKTDIKQDVRLPGDYLHDYEKTLAPGEKVVSSLLTGYLKGLTLNLCTQSKLESAKPTIFWVLKPVAAAYSTFTPNDILFQSLNKSIFICTADNIDLAVTSLKIGRLNEKITQNIPITYKLEISQSKTVSAGIKPSDYSGDELSYRYDFYLSNDNEYSKDDLLIPITYSNEQKLILQQGVTDKTPSVIPIEGYNLVVNKQAFYCGKHNYIIVFVKDLKNPIKIDPNLHNNWKATEVEIECVKDLLTFDFVQMTPVWPQKMLYRDAWSKFQLKATVTSLKDVKNSVDDRSLFSFKIFLSHDGVLDISKDPELDTNFDEDIFSIRRKGWKAMETRIFQETVNIKASQAICTFRPQFLFVYLVKNAQITLQEYVTENNAQYIPFSLNCQVKRIELGIKAFELVDIKTTYMTGAETKFNLAISIHLDGGAILEPLFKLRKSFDIKFYLSTNMTWEASDYLVDYKMSDANHEKLKSSYKTSVTDLLFNSEDSHKLKIPASLPPRFCGSVYLLVFVDNENQIEEADEINNIKGIPIFIDCQGDEFETKNWKIWLQPFYFGAPGLIEIETTARLKTGNVNETMFDFTVWVRQSAETIWLDITPDSWIQLNEERNGVKSVRGNLDFSAACISNVDKITSGLRELKIEARSNISKSNCVPQNNRAYRLVNVNCAGDYIDLTVNEFSLNGDLNLGKNAFILIFRAALSTPSVGWDAMSALSEPKFKYRFKVVSILPWIYYRHAADTRLDKKTFIKEERYIKYNSTQHNSVINEATRETRLINVSDSNLVFNHNELLLLCHADSSKLYVQVDSEEDINESSESNNINSLKLVVNSSHCFDGPPAKDVSVRAWRIKATNDIMIAGKSYEYDFEILLILVKPLHLNGLNGTDSTHMDVKFFMTDGEGSVDIPLELSSSQVEALKAWYWNISIIDLSANNLMIPLTNDTYKWCWKSIKIGVTVDNTNKQIEVNENNNDDYFDVIYDCGSEINECAMGLHNCDINAKCSDLPKFLYSNTLQPGFQCDCKPGFEGNGTHCSNINECEMGKHNCAKENSVCVDTHGSYKCSCKPGYASGSDNKCQNVNECTTLSHNCHEKAKCTDTIGSHECTCNPGYEGDGFTCTGYTYNIAI